MARLPDADRSRVLLIGTSTYNDPTLPQHLAVRNNLEELQAVLTHPEFGGLPGAHCRVLRDPKDPSVICDALDEAAAQAEDLLLIYYAGHGLLDEESRLFLATSGTRRQRLHYTALDVADIKRAFQHTQAKNRVLILDSCFSGRAIEQAMGDDVAASVLDASLDGAYFLTSVPANQRGFAPPGDRYTSFTGALLDLLRSGLPGGPPLLPLRLIHETLIRRLPEQGQPSPQQANTSTVADLALVRNRATVSPAAVTGPYRDGALATPGDERSSPREVSFAQKHRYVDLRRLLIGVIVLGGLAAISWRTPHSGPNAEQISLPDFAGVLIAMLIPILAVSAAFPRNYTLTFTHDHIELVVGRRVFSYPWVSVAQIRLVQRPMKKRRRASLVLLVRLQPGVLPPSTPRGAPTPRLVEEPATLSFLNVRRLDTRPEQVEQALERFAKAAWAPTPEITVPGAAQLAISKPQSSRFASRRPRLVLLAAGLLAVGLSPMGILSELGRIDLPVWRIIAITAWSLLLCAPAVAVSLLVLHPAVLSIDAQGLVFTRHGQTIIYAWQDLEHIAVLTTRQTGIWFPILFLRPLPGSELPPKTSNWWQLPRYSTWLSGVILCDLFSLTTSRKALEEAFARFAGATWRATFQPEGGLDDGTTRVGIGGQVVGLRTVLGCGACLLVAIPILQQILVPAVIPYPNNPLVFLLGQTIAIAGVLSALLVALYVRVPCTLILDLNQVVVTVRGQSVRIPWHQISYIRLVHTETTTAQVGGGQLITRSNDVLVYLRDDTRPPRSRWLLWPCCQKKYGGLVLAPINHPLLRWFVSPETIDRSIARFAGLRHLPRINRHVAPAQTKK